MEMMIGGKTGIPAVTSEVVGIAAATRRIDQQWRIDGNGDRWSKYGIHRRRGFRPE